jgi:hypothetical protein
MTKQCNACGGIYDDLGADGVAYYHVCPPITLVPVQRAGKAQLVPLTDLQGADEIVVQRGAERVQVPVEKALPDDVRLGDVQQRRDDHRDETPVPAVVDGKQGSAPRLEGVGATEIVVADADPLAVFATVTSTGA